MNLRKVSLVLPLMLMIVSSACERDTSVTVTDSNPPKFCLSGSGRLAKLRMQGQQVRDVPPIDASTVWEIVTMGDRFDGTRVGELECITYGELPSGYLQKYPKEGKAPPLVEDQEYSVSFDTVNANGAHAYFKFRNGQIVEIDFRGVESPR